MAPSTRPDADATCDTERAREYAIVIAMHTERVTLTLAASLLAAVDAQAERDAPGAPNRSATVVRLLAAALDRDRAGERVWHRVDVPAEWRERRVALLRLSDWCRPMVDALEGRERVTVPELMADAGQLGDGAGRARACYVLRRMGWEKE